MIAVAATKTTAGGHFSCAHADLGVEDPSDLRDRKVNCVLADSSPPTPDISEMSGVGWVSLVSP
jgi:hypothetical protein